MIDPVATVVTWMLANAQIIAQVGTFVWGEDVPGEWAETMPFKSIRVVMQNAPQERSVPTVSYMLQVNCFGATIIEAWEVARVVHDQMKRRGNETPILVGTKNVYWYYGECQNPGQYVMEPATNWPRVMSAWQTIFYELEVTP
jgi:hypothetical protein